jgi:hypothetical protein
MLESVVIKGLIAVGITYALRAIARVVGLEKLLSKKPLGCNLCMAFWSSLAAVLWQMEMTGFVPTTEAVLSTFALSYTLIELSYRPEPPPLLPIDDEDVREKDLRKK